MENIIEKIEKELEEKINSLTENTLENILKTYIEFLYYLKKENDLSSLGAFKISIYGKINENISHALDDFPPDLMNVIDGYLKNSGNKDLMDEFERNKQKEPEQCTIDFYLIFFNKETEQSTDIGFKMLFAKSGVKLIKNIDIPLNTLDRLMEFCNTVYLEETVRHYLGSKPEKITIYWDNE